MSDPEPINLSTLPLEQLQTNIIDIERRFATERRQISAAIKHVKVQEDSLAQAFLILRQAYINEINARLGKPKSNPIVNRAYAVVWIDRRSHITGYGIYSEMHPSPMPTGDSYPVVFEMADSLVSYDVAVRALLDKIAQKS